jgi:hypothetical protein
MGPQGVGGIGATGQKIVSEACWTVVAAAYTWSAEIGAPPIAVELAAASLPIARILSRTAAAWVSHCTLMMFSVMAL